jgi:hypothetical protein
MYTQAGMSSSTPGSEDLMTKTISDLHFIFLTDQRNIGRGVNIFIYPTQSNLVTQRKMHVYPDTSNEAVRDRIVALSEGTDIHNLYAVTAHCFRHGRRSLKAEQNYVITICACNISYKAIHF